MRMKRVGDKLIITHAQEGKDIYVENRDRREDETDGRWRGQGDVRWAARMGISELLKLEKEGIAQDEKEFLRYIEKNKDRLKVTKKRLI